PPPARTGRPQRDRRQIVDAILWILRTGAPWRDLAEDFGPWGTAWDLFDKWTGDGTLDTILSRLRSSRIDAGEVDNQLWCIDGTSVRAAPAGARKKRSERATGPRVGPFPWGFFLEIPPAVRWSWSPTPLPPDGWAGARQHGAGAVAGGGGR